MRRPWMWVFLVVAGAFGAFAQVTIKPDTPLIVPGTGLGWEVEDLRLLVRVEKAGEIEIKLYSPGFDPSDYRSPNELGDERYDGGKGRLLARFQLLSGNEVLADRQFGEEPHRWVTLYKGFLAAGEYELVSRFEGLGKNAVIYEVVAHTGRAQLTVAPSSMQTYNVVRDGWQTPFVVNIPKYSSGVRAGVYDGDGPRELSLKANTPEGELRPPVPGDREWTYVNTEKPGRYAFSFRIPGGAVQHTNTVGFRLFLGEVRVEVVDEAGNPVPGAGYRMSGEYVREVVPVIPEGWVLSGLQISDGELIDGRAVGETQDGRVVFNRPPRVVFGLGAGSVRFVLSPATAESGEAAPAREEGTLALSAQVVCGGWRKATGLSVTVGDRRLTLSPEGVELSLPPGEYVIAADAVPGAEVVGPKTVSIAAGEVSRVAFEVRPRMRVVFEELPETLRVGETARIVAAVRTDFDGEVPADLTLWTSKNLRIAGPERAAGTVSRRADLRLETEVEALEAGKGSVVAESSPCGVRAEGALELVAPAPVEPRAELERSLSRDALLPGERTEVCLTVRSVGDAPLSYELVDRTPDWLQPQSAANFEGTLAPGESRQHCYTARAGAGAAAEGKLVARLESSAGVLTNEAAVRRVPLGLEKSVEPSRMRLGKRARFTVTVANPLERAVRVTLREVPAEGLGLRAETLEVELGPRERRTFAFEALPTRVGRLKNRAEAYVDGVAAAPPAEAELVVEPPMLETRVSEVHVEFAVDEGQGDALLIRHAPPAGARYRLGSSRLNGASVADPRQDDEGRLYWLVPFAEGGDLSYVLEHEGALGQLPEPELTLLVSGEEVPLKGNLSLEDYEAARELGARLLAGPTRRAVAGETVVLELLAPATVEREGERLAGRDASGTVELPLQPGENRFVIRSAKGAEEAIVYRSGPAVSVRLQPVAAVADGRSPLVYELYFEDEAGLPAAVDRATVAATPEPIDPDFDPLTSGYQVPVEAGVATLRLRPMSTPGEVRIQVLLGDEVRELSDYVRAADRALYLAQGSVTVRLGSRVEWGGLARGYAETPLGKGHLQAAADVTYADRTLYKGLTRPEDPTSRFPLTGSGEETRLPLASDDGVAFRYDLDDLTVGYGRVPEGYSALYLEHRGPLYLRGQVGLVARDRITERIAPDGSRVYVLSRPARPGSEAVYLESGGRRVRLVPYVDYALDALSGTLYFTYALWPTDAEMNPQTLVVEYAPLSASRDAVAFGVSAGYRAGPFGLQAFAGSRDFGQGYDFGLAASYRIEGFEGSVRYRHEGDRDTLGLSASGRVGRYAASANLSYDGALAGRARVSAEVTPSDRVALEHEGNNRMNETRVLYERKFGEGLNAGVGLGYRWEEASFAGVARAGYEGAQTQLALTHSQSFAGAARTSFSARHALDANLALTADLAYAWGVGLEGFVGLDQKVGTANLALGYRLPGASGEGNRARFGVRAPFVLSEGWSLDVDAGASYDFDDGARLLGAGVGLRYRSEGLTGTVGMDGSVGDAGTKFALRAGVAGALDDRQVVSADANFQLLPERRGRFSVSYAFRGEAVQALTYHRYQTHPAEELEGELALAWHPGLSLQLRPSAAYRLHFDDPEGNTYQVGLGMNYYFTRRLGVGGGVYYIAQPAAHRSSLAFSVEGSFRVADPVWLNLGYTFGNFDGVTLEASPGFYLRADLFGGVDGNAGE